MRATLGVREDLVREAVGAGTSLSDALCQEAPDPRPALRTGPSPTVSKLSSAHTPEEAPLYDQDISAATDLPPFETLWAHAALDAALMHGNGDDDPFSPHRADEGQIRYDDSGGNDWWLLRLEGGRGVLIGQDHESDTVYLDEEGGDLFRDGPDWLPWELLLDHERDNNVGFLYWWDGQAWDRTPYPDHIGRDGVHLNLGGVLSEEGLLERLTDNTDLGEENTAELTGLLPRLVRAALTRKLTESALAQALPLLHQSTDPTAAIGQADALGLTPNGGATVLPAGHHGPVRRDMIVCCSRTFGLYYADAMRRTEEIPGRPTPEDGPELLRLVEWARHRMGPDGRLTLTHNAIEAHWRARPREWKGPEEMLLWRSLFEAEDHPEHGGWLYARLEVTREGHTLRRAYDHWPTWWNDHAAHPGEDGMISYGFVSGLGERDRYWRPEWSTGGHRPPSSLPAPQGWDRPGGTEPSFPWAPIAPDERDALLDDLREILVEEVTGEWTALSLDVDALVDHLGVVCRVRRPDSTRGERFPSPPALSRPLRRLREGMYERGVGTWFRASFSVDTEGVREEGYDHTNEPDFGRRITELDHQLDFRYFPRQAEHLPEWLRRKIAPPAKAEEGVGL